LIFIDKGPGIKDIDLAMKDGYSTGKSMGLGLPGAKRLVNFFEIKSEPGIGTTITIIKWKNG
jgi:serine/threonine-protein kinase RsbT